MKSAQEHIDLVNKVSPPNYASLPVVLSKGEGVFLFDVDGKRYFDMLSAYSAVNQGHCHPRLVKVMQTQSAALCLTSRAFQNDKLGPFLEKLSTLTGFEKAVPMNSGAEGVETAIKIMRKWGYENKNIPEDQAEILVCQENFHGRTTTIVSFSSDPSARNGFGPGTPGFTAIPFGDAEALKAAITPNTVGFLVEPVQGEAGINIPPKDYLNQVRKITREQDVLLCCDEIQTGLCRTGKMFCHQHAGIRPDLMVLGKALSGGFYPISAVVGDAVYLDVLTPGTHGSTYGGNPLASAIGLEALSILEDENLAQAAETQGAYFRKALAPLTQHDHVKEVRGVGLLNAVAFHDQVAKDYCKKLMQEGVLAKDTHGSIIRFAPPLTITPQQIDEACQIILRVLGENP